MISTSSKTRREREKNRLLLGHLYCTDATAAALNFKEMFSISWGWRVPTAHQKAALGAVIKYRSTIMFCKKKKTNPKKQL